MLQYDHSKRTPDYTLSNLQLSAGYLDPLFC